MAIKYIHVCDRCKIGTESSYETTPDGWTQAVLRVNNWVQRRIAFCEGCTNGLGINKLRDNLSEKEENSLQQKLFLCIEEIAQEAAQQVIDDQ